MAKVRTAKQKAALKKAQLVSARKRKGRGRGRKIATVAAVGAVAGAGYLAYRKHQSGSKIKGHPAKQHKPKQAAHGMGPKPSAHHGARPKPKHVAKPHSSHNPNDAALNAELDKADAYLADAKKKNKHGLIPLAVGLEHQRRTSAAFKKYG